MTTAQRITTNWGYAQTGEQGWWYVVSRDGLEVDRDAGFADRDDMEEEMARAVDRRHREIEIEEGTVLLENTGSRVVLVVAPDLRIAEAFVKPAHTLLGLGDGVPCVPMAYHDAVPSGVRPVGACLVACNMNDRATRVWVGDTFRGQLKLPAESMTYIAGAGGPPGRDLLGG